MELFETPKQDRIETVVDAVIFELSEKDISGVYVEKLGLLTVLVEAYYYDAHNQEYIGFEEDHYLPKCVAEDGLQYALDTYLSRPAFPNKQRTHKIATDPSDDPNINFQNIVSEVVAESIDLDSKTLKQHLRNGASDLYWTG